jgi:hypothetical protein
MNKRSFAARAGHWSAAPQEGHRRMVRVRDQRPSSAAPSASSRCPTRRWATASPSAATGSSRPQVPSTRPVRRCSCRVGATSRSHRPGLHGRRARSSSRPGACGTWRTRSTRAMPATCPPTGAPCWSTSTCPRISRTPRSSSTRRSRRRPRCSARIPRRPWREERASRLAGEIGCPCDHRCSRPSAASRAPPLAQAEPLPRHPRAAEPGPPPRRHHPPASR